MAPAEAGEAGEIPVRGDPSGAGFDGKGGEPGIGDQVAPGAGPIAEIDKEVPKALGGMDQTAARAGTKRPDESKRVGKLARWREDPGMGGDTKETGERPLR